MIAIAHPAIVAKPANIAPTSVRYRVNGVYAQLHDGYCQFWIRRGKTPMAVSREYVEDWEAFCKWAAITRERDLQREGIHTTCGGVDND